MRDHFQCGRPPEKPALVITVTDGKSKKRANRKPPQKRNKNVNKNSIETPTADNCQLNVVTAKIERIVIDKKPTKCQSKRLLVGECCICTEDIFDDHKIWFCEQCTVSIHLECIKSWLGGRIGNDKLVWSCPICRNEVMKKPEFRCYCGKVVNPPKATIKGRSTSRVDIYCYSCGNSCGRSRPQQKLCSHRCVDRCHPGACQQCSATVVRKCFCGKTEDKIRCSMLDIYNSFPFNFSCKNVCGKLKNCNNHTCELTCHSGPCEVCDVVVGVANCFSHQTTRSVLCGQSVTSFDCGEKCDKLLPCGNHKCENNCHPGSCSPCDTDVHRVTRCGCGKTRLDTLVADPRKSCLDVIPTCDKICDKLLQCGSNKEVHKCRNKCHNGPCPPCDHPMEVHCRCGSKLFKTTCQNVNNHTADGAAGKTVFKCNKRCKIVKQCHRHKCDSVCCDLPPSHHFCALNCGAKLECGRHTCTKSCHPKGLCGKCDHYDNHRVECMCGKVSVPPPILCGSRIPSCDQPCPEPHPCGHPQTHMCHLKSVSCSRCCYPTEKYCNCGKVKQKNVPCFESDVTCGLVCGKLLPCSTAEYPHYCSRPCHSGDCCKLPAAESNLYFLANPSKHYRVISGTQALKCVQLCGVVRSCGHPCNLPCHGLSKCPSTKCLQEVLISCDCGELIEKKLCHTLTENKTDSNAAVESTTHPTQPTQHRLECNEKCHQILRNKKLAQALDLDVISHYKGFYPKTTNNFDCPEYSEFLLNAKTNNKIIVVAVEELFSKAVFRSRSQPAEELESKFKLYTDIFSQDTSNVWKRVMHEYSEHFGCYYHYQGDYIKIVTTKNLSKVPSKLLSAVSLYGAENITK